MDEKILNDVYKPVQQAVRERAVRMTNLKVIEYSPKTNEEALIGLQGMVMAFIAPKGTGIAKLIEKATRDPKAAAALQDRMRQRQKKTKRVTLKKAVDMLVKSDVFAELRLGPETLVQTLFIPDGLEIMFEEFAYNGGPLPKDGFQLLERVKPGSDAALEAVVLKVNPVLTAAETAALSKVPTALWGSNLAAATCCGDSYTAVTVVVTDAIAAAVYATITLACLMPVPLVPSLGNVELNRLGPAASAKKLLDLRQAAITKNWPTT